MRKPAVAHMIRRIYTTRRGSFRSTSFEKTISGAKGADYSLEKFHEDFIKQGSIPIKLMRRILLKGDQAPTL